MSGQPLGEVIAPAENRNPACLRPISRPHSPRGALCVLFGNLAPEGAVVKVGAVEQHQLRFQGPARVFDSEEDATNAVINRRVAPGTVIVVRYEGPRGGPACARCLR